MTLWLLDTDTVSLLLEKHPVVSQRVTEAGADVVISIVTIQEIFNGWVTRINSAKNLEEVLRLYNKFYRAVLLCKRVPVLNFDQPASMHFVTLLQEQPELSKQRLNKDMRIAAIALANHAIVVTRNHRDFSLVRGLQITDWSILNSSENEQ
jgi:tRNA(fMet)-specific endonuclease VapC